MPSVGISRGGGREEGGGEAVSRMQCSQVLMWGRQGEEKGGMLDVFSDGLHLKRAFTLCSPLLLKIPTFPFSLRVSIASVLNLYCKKRIQHPLKCFPQRDRSHLTNPDCAIALGTVDRSFLFLPLCILVCVCVCV